MLCSKLCDLFNQIWHEDEEANLLFIDFEKQKQQYAEKFLVMNQELEMQEKSLKEMNLEPASIELYELKRCEAIQERLSNKGRSRSDWLKESPN